MTYSSVKVGGQWTLQDTNGVVYNTWSDQHDSDKASAQANFNDAHGGVPLIHPRILIAFTRLR